MAALWSVVSTPPTPALGLPPRLPLFLKTGIESKSYFFLEVTDPFEEAGQGSRGLSLAGRVRLLGWGETQNEAALSLALEVGTTHLPIWGNRGPER